jgi:hypothetical protein
VLVNIPPAKTGKEIDETKIAMANFNLFILKNV